MSQIYEISPYQDHLGITPSDTPLAAPFRGLFVGGAGTVIITSRSGVDATYTVTTAGQFLNVVGTRVRAASTATLIVALF